MEAALGPLIVVLWVVFFSLGLYLVHHKGRSMMWPWGWLLFWFLPLGFLLILSMPNLRKIHAQNLAKANDIDVTIR